MSSPVTLQLAFPKVFVAGFGSFFYARLVNDDIEPLRCPVLTFSCPDFDPPEVSVPFDVIAPNGGYQDMTVSVSPVRAGSRPLGVVVEFSDKDISSARIATWEGLTIFEKPANEINVTNIIRDVQSHRSSGEKAEFGAVKGDVSINVTNSMGDVRTLNDLLSASFPAQFNTVRLRGFGTTDMFVVSDRRRIPHALTRVFEPAAVLSLTPRASNGSSYGNGAAANTEHAPLGWRLKGGGQPLVLGRSSVDVDLVTRFMPATPSNDAMSAGMSRKHARLSVCKEGRLQVENITSGNVVLVGSQFVPSGALMQVNAGQLISLGTVPADLRLAVNLQPGSHQEMRIINLHEWSGNTATTHHSDVLKPAWGHAVFTWPNSAASFWHSVWFTRLVSFGSGREAAIQLADDPAEDLLSPCHGYFHYLRGCYWLEVVSPRGNVTLSDPHVQDGQPFAVLPGQIIPLRGGMTLTLGRTVLDVARVA